MSGSLWVREIRRNRIIRDTVVPCGKAGWEEALAAACRALDLGVPVVMEKHRRDVSDFGQARFLPEHFLESVRFDRLEAEYFEQGEKDEKPRGAG